VNAARALAVGLFVGLPALARADDTFSARGKVEAFLALRSTLPSEGELNPGNAALHLPLANGALELRPALTVEYGRWLTFLARPRLAVAAGAARVDGAWDGGRGEAAVEWAELSVTWRLSDALAFTWGLQNFQWGPAELLSPSNRLFHQTGLLRDVLFFVPGQHLLRVNASAGKAWTAVLLAELTPAPGEVPFTAGEPFSPKGQLKLEWADEQGRGQVGVAGGVGTRTWPFFGEYAQWQLTDGLSVYADASHSSQRTAWYPALAAESPAFVHRASVPEHLATTAVGGARYAFEGGLEVRVEALFNEAGWSRDELRAAGERPLAWAQPQQFAPGLEFLGRWVGYASARLPDLPPGKRLALSARYAHSFTDDSGAGFLTLTLDASDAAVVFASALVTHGTASGEFSRVARAAFSAGASYSW
jgi:hypothetical protein